MCRQRVKAARRNAVLIVDQAAKRASHSGRNTGADPLKVGPTQTKGCSESQAALGKGLEARLRQLFRLRVEANDDTATARYDTRAEPEIVACAGGSEASCLNAPQSLSRSVAEMPGPEHGQNHNSCLKQAHK